MAEFLTENRLDEKLTDIIWYAKKELIILSPFIRLDDYCKKIFKKLLNNPDLEIILVFGKNEGEAERSLKRDDLEFFKSFVNITIIYCNNLHAKYYANEKVALLTSLNLLGKSMTENVEYGIAFLKNENTNDELYVDSKNYTKQVIANNPCVFVQRPYYGARNSKNDFDIIRMFDVTESLYNNRRFPLKFYNEFELETHNFDNKPSRENSRNSQHHNNSYEDDYEYGYCIRTGVKIPFNPQKPFTYDAYQTWAISENWNYRENYCHRTGRESHGRTSMANPILF